MKSIPLSLSPSAWIAGQRILIEQGIPVHPMDPAGVSKLRLVLDGEAVEAEIQPEATDSRGQVRWVMVTAAVDAPASGQAQFSLEEAPGLDAGIPTLRVEEAGDTITIKAPAYTLNLHGKDGIRLETSAGKVLDGRLDFSARTDSRSFVSGVRALRHRAHGFTVEEKSKSRCLVVWKLRVHPDVYREYDGIDERRYLDCELELRAYAALPVLRLKWSFTNNFYYPAALEKYALTLPLSKTDIISGDWQGTKFNDWTQVATSGGILRVNSPSREDFGPGIGQSVERLEWIYDEPDGFSVEDVAPDTLPDSSPGTKPAKKYNSATRPAVFKTEYRLAIGGINPALDGPIGADQPQVFRTLLHGMSRSFEASLVVGDNSGLAAAERRPAYFTVPAQHYSDTGNLPERGDMVDFGEYEKEATRAARWLRDHQWRGSLYCGEWWREYDVAIGQGIEESGSGNSALGVYYHYLRTGDYGFLESARRSMRAIGDLTLNKQQDSGGPYVHARRFLLDRENWHHPRYQRISGMMKPSHIFCDRRLRKRACATVKWFAENFLDTDGAPMSPSSRDIGGRKERCTEAAMSQFVESLVLAYEETGDPFFLEKARLMADWAVNQMEEHRDILDWMKNWNIQFVQRGLLAIYLATWDEKYKDAFLKICRNILRIRPQHDGYKDLILWEVHFVVYFAWHFSEAHRMTGDDELLKTFVAVLETELERQVEDGTFPYITAFTPRTSEWISYYDTKTAAAYLPVLAARMKAAGISRSEAAKTALPWESDGRPVA